jgi:hypothetical protein
MKNCLVLFCYLSVTRVCVCVFFFSFSLQGRWMFRIRNLEFYSQWMLRRFVSADVGDFSHWTSTDEALALFSNMFLVYELQQPRPVACSSCNSNGHIECKWCAGTGFFVLGDKMLCQVPSNSTSCVICTGKVNQILICQYPSIICSIIPQFPICTCYM